jgi:hypothetical protein
MASRGVDAPTELEGHRGVGLAGADAVDARHRGDDDHVAPRQEREGRGVAHPIDLFVDDRVLLDEGVGGRDVGLGLVVVVVADEVVDGVVGEQLLQLAVELGGEDLVVDHDQGRPLGRGDDVGHGVGLARPGDPEQDLGGVAAVQTVDQVGDRLGLVPGRRERAAQLEERLRRGHRRAV